MKAERAKLHALLESIADGTPIDWATLEGDATTEAQRRQYRNLRLVARVTGWGAGARTGSLGGP